MYFKKYFCLFFIVMVLVGCTNQKTTSPMLFSGEGEDWIVEMVIQQKGNGDTYHAVYRYNMTYKKNDEKYIQKWLEGEEVTLDYDIEGLNIEDNPQIRIFHGNQDYWKSGVTNNSVSEPYTKEDDFEVFLKLDDGKKETFSMNFNEDRTEDLKNIDGNVINNSLKGPIGVEYERFFKGALIK